MSGIIVRQCDRLQVTLYLYDCPGHKILSPKSHPFFHSPSAAPTIKGVFSLPPFSPTYTTFNLRIFASFDTLTTSRYHPNRRHSLLSVTRATIEHNCTTTSPALKIPVQSIHHASPTTTTPQAQRNEYFPLSLDSSTPIPPTNTPQTANPPSSAKKNSATSGFPTKMNTPRFSA